MTCPRCLGRGSLHGVRCHVCGGSGSPSWGRARASDPSTSHAAAASVNDKLRESQSAVLAFLRDHGWATDELLVNEYERWRSPGMPQQSPSGLRTRRAELVDRGLVHDTGQRVRLASGRQAIVWRPTNEGDA